MLLGRIKDLLIVRGRNYYPQDLEQTVEQVCVTSNEAMAGGQLEATVRAGCVAAFSIGEDQNMNVLQPAEIIAAATV